MSRLALMRRMAALSADMRSCRSAIPTSLSNARPANPFDHRIIIKYCQYGMERSYNCRFHVDGMLESPSLKWHGTAADEEDAMARPKPVPAAELAAAVADRHGCSQAEARRALDSVQAAVSGLVAGGRAVRLPRLATFAPVDVPQRQVRNPATGETRTAAPTRQVRISATGPLKAAVKAGP